MEWGLPAMATAQELLERQARAIKDGREPDLDDDGRPMVMEG